MYRRLHSIQTTANVEEGGEVSSRNVERGNGDDEPSGRNTQGDGDVENTLLVAITRESNCEGN